MKPSTKRSRAHRAKLAKEHGRLIQVELTAEASERLDQHVAQHGTTKAAVNAAVIAYKPRKKS